jgi:hypothetical protein
MVLLFGRQQGWNISDLEFSREELVDYLLYYKGIYLTYYAGHSVKEY